MQKIKNTKIIKIGGSVITYKKGKPRLRKKVLQSVVEEITDAYKKAKFNFVLVNGAGSFGHYLVSKKGLNNVKSIVEIHESVRKLNSNVVKIFLENNCVVVPIEPLSIFVLKNKNVKKAFYENIKYFIKKGFNVSLFGDVCIDEKKGFSVLSGDTIVSFLAEKLNVKDIVFVSDVDGIYIEKGKILEKANRNKIEEIFREIDYSFNRYDVTGGMKKKLEELLKLRKKKVFFVNGLKRGLLYRCLTEGYYGTLIEL